MIRKLFLILIFIICKPVFSQLPVYMTYNQIQEQLIKWNNKSPKITNLGSFGYTTNNRKRVFIEVKGKNSTNKILVHACIHGNECLATNMCLGYCGMLLSKYNSDKTIQDLVDSRDIYFVPVLSVEAYPSQREVNGKDPNRDFNSRNPVPPVRDIIKLFNIIKPVSTISIHTFGRKLLMPPGDSTGDCANSKDYKSILGSMAHLSNYNLIKASQLYGHPIYGTEVDYYYKHGSFSFVWEVGVDQCPNNWNQIKEEFTRTWPAFLHFIKESPNVKISTASAKN